MTSDQERIKSLIDRGCNPQKAAEIVAASNAGRGKTIPAPIFELTQEQEAHIIAQLPQMRGIICTSGSLHYLVPVEVYTGKTIKARRLQADELDNVTVWKI